MKKNIFLSILTAMSIMSYCKAMDEQEKKCMEYFNNSNLKNQALKKLEIDSFTSLTNGMRYQEDPEKFDKIYKELTAKFYKILKENNIEITWQEDFFLSVLIKSKIARDNNCITPTDETSAKQFLYAQLSEEQKKTFHKDGYLSNPKATENVMLQLSNKFAELLAEMNIIENTLEAKQLKAHEYFEQKMKDFKILYEEQ